MPHAIDQSFSALVWLFLRRKRLVMLKLAPNKLDKEPPYQPFGLKA